MTGKRRPEWTHSQLEKFYWKYKVNSNFLIDSLIVALYGYTSAFGF